MEQLVSPSVIKDATFQEFYDPNHHLTGRFSPFGERRLLKYLDAKRVDPVLLPSPDGPVPVAGRQLLAVEMAHAMLISESDFTQAQHLGLSETRLLEATQLAEFGALQVVKGVHAAARVLLEKNHELAELTVKRDPMQLLIHGVALAAAAHRGEVRLSGHPYVYHPIDCAAISGIAARKEGDIFTDEERYVLRLKQFVDLLHDSFEDEFESKGKERGGSFLTPRDKRVVASPLVQYRLLEYLGFSQEHSYIGARSNFVLTKTVGPDGRMKYGPYANRLHRGKWELAVETGRLVRTLHLETPLAASGKGVDLHHNEKVDPKRMPEIDAEHHKARKQRQNLKRKQNKYGRVFRTGARKVAQSDADPMIKRIYRNIRKVSPKDLDDMRGSARILALLRHNDMLLGAWDEGQRRLAEGTDQG